MMLRTSSAAKAAAQVSYPLIVDEGFELAKAVGARVQPASSAHGLGADDDATRERQRAARDAVRDVFVVANHDARVRLRLTYPATTGWSTFELLRCVDSLRRCDLANAATPVNWVPGRDVLVDVDVDAADALRDFPRGVRVVDVPSGRDDLRLTPDPVAPPPASLAVVDAPPSSSSPSRRQVSSLAGAADAASAGAADQQHETQHTTPGGGGDRQSGDTTTPSTSRRTSLDDDDEDD